jgi:hypothetical protein
MASVGVTPQLRSAQLSLAQLTAACLRRCYAVMDSVQLYDGISAFYFISFLKRIQYVDRGKCFDIVDDRPMKDVLCVRSVMRTARVLFPMSAEMDTATPFV